MTRTLTRLLALSAGCAAIAAGSTASAETSPVHASSCRHVRIQHHRVCLAPGRYCTRQWQRYYHHYGYSCSVLDRNDRYRLRRLRRS